jgi:hypothetical protein
MVAQIRVPKLVRVMVVQTARTVFLKVLPHTVAQAAAVLGVLAVFTVRTSTTMVRTATNVEARAVCTAAAVVDRAPLGAVETAARAV